MPHIAMSGSIKSVPIGVTFKPQLLKWFRLSITERDQFFLPRPPSAIPALRIRLPIESSPIRH
jgi:hypothetical protein